MNQPRTSSRNRTTTLSLQTGDTRVPAPCHTSILQHQGFPRLLLACVAAIHGDCSTRDPCIHITGEEHGSRGNVLGCTQAAEGMSRDNPGLDRWICHEAGALEKGSVDV